MHERFPLMMRRWMAGLLAVAGVAYAALIVATYVHTSASNALAPKFSELRRLAFRTERPVSPMERRLEASDTPLGTGPLISGSGGSAPSMRFVFAGASDQTMPLTNVELAQREGERQALLDWVRSGGSRKAYEQDEYLAASATLVSTITPEFLVRKASTSQPSDSEHVRIRSLINERCVTCHIPDDGDDTARLIPFDNYDSIARYLTPDEQGNEGRPWLVAALASLFPLALLACPAFAWTGHSLAVRKRLVATTIAALAVLAASWLAGAALAPLLFIAALIALICIELQLLASVAELLGR